MRNKSCPSCAKKIDKDFNYCPWCGAGIKNLKEKQDYGILGKNDNLNGNLFSQEAKLPFGMNKIVSSLMKQIEKEMGGAGKNMNGMPQGFNIKIHTKNPINITQPLNKKITPEIIKISDEEKKRRINLPRKEAVSRIKRLSDSIIYEIESLDVKDKSQVAITKLEKGFEIRIYTKNMCYIKNISLDMKLIDVKIKKDLVLVEFKE